MAVAKTKQVEETKSAPAWEIKDRMYFLLGDVTPLTYKIKSKNIAWFDEELGYEREITYTENQKTLFVDEFKGPARLGHIIFRDGDLFVPKEKVTLQKLLSLYHPDRNKLFAEVDNEADAIDELQDIELEIEALMVARDIDIDRAEAIVRVNVGSEVNKMTSKEIKRDLLVFAKRNPVYFLELANDENINIRNAGIKAVEQGIIKLGNDQRTFSWAETNQKLLTVPFGENPYSALAAFFKTDDGIEVYQSVEKKLK